MTKPLQPSHSPIIPTRQSDDRPHAGRSLWGNEMKKKIVKKIERLYQLHVRVDKLTVTVRRPCGRMWVERTYKPTASSLARVKRIVKYPFSPIECLNDGKVWQRIYSNYPG